MSVSTIRAISILLLLAAHALADLPSCARAKCVHCAVDFIDRMCPTACSGCKPQHQSISAVNLPRPPQPPPAFNTQPQFAQSVNTRQVSNEGGLQVPRPQQQQISQQPQVQQFQQQAVSQPQQQPILNIPLQPHAQPVQFAAPVYQGQQIPYPQAQASPAQVQTATLAPLVEPPKVATFDLNLSRQPADLAQPLPEYQSGQVAFQQPAQIQFPQQQGFGLPQAPQQQGYGQQVDNIFAQPNPFQLPAAQQGQGLFGAPGTSAGQQPAAFNPFQPFLQQTNAAFDPFNLFNLNANPLAVNQQGISTVQTQQQQYGQVQHQGTYNQNFNQQPQQQQQQQYNQQYQQPQRYTQQPQQQQYNQQPQQQQYNQQPQQPQQAQYINQQPQQQYNQQPQQQFNQQPPAQPQQQQYQNQNNYQPQPAPQQQQLPVAPQQQVQQPRPQQPLPQSVAASVDSRPVNFEKYVDPGKGTPLAPPPQAAQCPRQPGWQPCIAKDTANDRFRNCCSRLGEGCAPLCNYDATLATMQLAVLTGRCPLSKVGDVMICASGYQDATQCCEAYGVFEPGYEHCRPYCNPSAGLPEGGLLTEKYKCLVKLSHIQQCFFVSQKP